MCDLAMGLTTLASRTGSMTLITVKEAGFLKVQRYSRRLLKGENALLVIVKGKKHGPRREEKTRALKGTPKVSVTPEDMSLHPQEMNLEKQTGEKSESETRGEPRSSTTGLT